MARQLSNRQIAQELVISVHTVENHVARILKKLNLHLCEQVAARMAGQRHPLKILQKDPSAGRRIEVPQPRKARELRPSKR